MFREKGLGKVEMPPKPGIPTRPNAFIHAVPGYIPSLESGRHEVGFRLSHQPGKRPALHQRLADHWSSELPLAQGIKFGGE